MTKFMVDLRSQSVNVLSEDFADKTDIWYYTVKAKSFDEAWRAAIARAEDTLEHFVKWKASIEKSSVEGIAQADETSLRIDKTINGLLVLIRNAKETLS